MLEEKSRLRNGRDRPFRSRFLTTGRVRNPAFSVHRKWWISQLSLLLDGEICRSGRFPGGENADREMAEIWPFPFLESGKSGRFPLEILAR